MNPFAKIIVTFELVESGDVLALYRKIHHALEIFLSRARQDGRVAVAVDAGAAKAVHPGRLTFIGLFYDALPHRREHQRAVGEDMAGAHVNTLSCRTGG